MSNVDNVEREDRCEMWESRKTHCRDALQRCAAKRCTTLDCTLHYIVGMCANTFDVLQLASTVIDARCVSSLCWLEVLTCVVSQCCFDVLTSCLNAVCFFAGGRCKEVESTAPPM